MGFEIVNEAVAEGSEPDLWRYSPAGSFRRLDAPCPTSRAISGTAGFR